MVDRLAALLHRFELRARVFNSGPLCEVMNFDAAAGVGHVHVLESGRMRVESPGEPAFELVRPTLLMYLRPTHHRFVVDPRGGARTVCASIQFSGPGGNPLVAALPGVVVVELAAVPGFASTIGLLFDEAFARRCGRQAMLDRLSEMLVIQVLRWLMEERPERQGARGGLLAGLSDPRLARALTAIHDDPGGKWTLERLAGVAGMSRARFAAAFRDTVGCTAGEYLAQWRLGIACNLLSRGRPLARVAEAVGYGGVPAFTRAFAARYGCPPRAWARRGAETNARAT